MDLLTNFQLNMSFLWMFSNSKPSINILEMPQRHTFYVNKGTGNKFTNMGQQLQ